MVWCGVIGSTCTKKRADLNITVHVIFSKPDELSGICNTHTHTQPGERWISSKASIRLSHIFTFVLKNNAIKFILALPPWCLTMRAHSVAINPNPITKGSNTHLNDLKRGRKQINCPWVTTSNILRKRFVWIYMVPSLIVWGKLWNMWRCGVLKSALPALRNLIMPNKFRKQ